MTPREIKFRAWDKRFKSMRYASPMAILKMDDGDHEIMQFTGLKDVNGREIYEGDVVKDTRDGKVGGVSWDSSWMKWNVGAEGYWADDAPYVAAYMEVIGNALENPELLK